MLGFNFETLVQTSKQFVEKFKTENVFNSKTLNEFFQTGFRPKGTKPNSIYALSRTTGEPVEVFVKYHTITNDDQTEYFFNIFDSKNKKIGEKNFSTYFDSENKQKLRSGFMTTELCDIVGLGILEDALQIETALNLGIRTIPRTSLPKATLFHTKMGFLPVSTSLREVSCQEDINKFLNRLIKKSHDIKSGNFKPIIVEKDGKFYLDENTVKTIANAKEVKEQMIETGERRLDDLDGYSTMLELSGKELSIWEEAIRKFPLLERIQYKRVF